MKHLALTIGDPTGIGSEITAKALQRLGEFQDIGLTVIGSIKTLESAAAQLGLKLPHSGHIAYRAIEDNQPGEVAYQAIHTAVQMIDANEAEALVTGPISKRNLNAAGYAYPGHTEILEELTRRIFGIDNARAEMLFVHKKLRLMILTRHIPLRDTPFALSQSDKVEQSLSILVNFLRQKLHIDRPHLAILGVNPHAGEIGGSEEENILKPLIKDLYDTGLADCDGPLAADGFFRSLDPQNSGYDAIVAAYHDQGLIPFKMMAGYEAVNMTIGLPFIRTSVGHGTAEDIVGQGIAREDSLIAALHTAVESL